jgi:hypothetical protein
MIAELIDKSDNWELIADQIAAILANETASQQALATAANKDPALWKLRVFSDRANPFSEFIDSPDGQTVQDRTPIVNVAFDSATFDASASNVVERQKAVGTFNIDCFGCGISQDNATGGHVSGDEDAADESARAVRLVRNILMAGEYTYLGMRGVVWKRFPAAITTFQPAIDSRPVERVMGARFALTVEFNEFSPQVQPVTLELLTATVKRAENGEVFLVAQYPGS